MPIMYAGRTASLPAQTASPPIANSRNNRYFASSSDDPATIAAEKSRSEKWQHCEDDNGHDNKYKCPVCEWREDQAERDYRAEIVDETGCEDGFAEISRVESEF